MTLADVRDYIASLNITEPQKVYMGKLDVKPDKTIGVYHSKHQHTYKTAIGGAFLESYGTKYVTLLVIGINPQEIQKRQPQPYLRL